ncbi:MAG TPA: arsenic resistance N-acetyltransferase ArsN2 [Thermoanaerobaculia bacterium]
MVSIADLRVNAATPADLDDILSLLDAMSLPTAGVAAHIGTFVVARDGAKLVACGGSEPYQFVALVRSIAVRPEYQQIGLGRRIVRELIDRLSSRGIREFYLLTMTAEEYFKKRGFRTIDRDEVHPQLLDSEELKGACPSTAVCMRLVMT